MLSYRFRTIVFKKVIPWMVQKRHVSIPDWELSASMFLCRTLSGPKASRNLEPVHLDIWVQVDRDQKNLAIRKESFL